MTIIVNLALTLQRTQWNELHSMQDSRSTAPAGPPFPGNPMSLAFERAWNRGFDANIGIIVKSGKFKRNPRVSDKLCNTFYLSITENRTIWHWRVRPATKIAANFFQKSVLCSKLQELDQRSTLAVESVEPGGSLWARERPFKVLKDVTCR